MLERKTRIICTIGDLRKDVERKNGVSDTAYREAVTRRLETEILAFVKAGMNVARINMAHFEIDQKVASYSDKDYLRDLIKTVRKVSRKLEKPVPVAIMGDIQGPKVRIAGLVTEKVLKSASGKEKATNIALLKMEFLNQPIEEIPSQYLRIGVSYEGNFDFVRDIRENRMKRTKPIEIHIGEKGPILRVTGFIKNDKGILCETIEGGEIKNRDGVSVKNSKIKPGDYNLRYYPKDQIDLKFLLNDTASGKDKLLVDVIALSFVRSNVDIHNLQDFIKGILQPDEINKRFGRQDFPIISKIETQEGVDDIRRGGGILEDSYAVMVARGDLGLYCRIEEVAKYQKDIIRMCRRREKPVIVATEMLDRMIEQADPSRAESTDVFNAVCDGADALMLSGETAKGKHRRESVETMHAIIKVAEKHLQEEKDYEYRLVQLQRKIVELFRYARRDLRNLWKKDRVMFQKEKGNLEVREDAHYIAYSACELASQLGCSAIIALSQSGGTARLIARYRPETRIIAGVYTQNVANILMLSYGVEPVVIEEEANGVEEQFALLKRIATRVDLPKGPDWLSQRVVAVAGSPVRTPGSINYLHILHY